MPSSDPTDRTPPGGPADPHDPRFELDLQDALVLIALGEPAPDWVEHHRRSCRRCQEELAGLAQTVRVARETVPARAELDAVPSPAVWDGIVAELGLGRGAPDVTPIARGRSAGTPQLPQLPVPPAEPARRARWRGVLAAAAVVALAVGGGIGYAVGRNGSQSQGQVQVTARLAQLPDGPAGVSGKATVHSTGSGEQLSVTTDGLPLRTGYYEVWLYDPQADRMVAIGALADDGTGTFPVPPGLDVRSYNVVDVSAQDYDGDPRHKQSVLRGGLTR